jgi:hypothetical protein
MDDDDTKPQLPMVIIDQSGFTAEINMFILKTQLKHSFYAVIQKNLEFICTFWSKSS